MRAPTRLQGATPGNTDSMAPVARLSQSTRLQRKEEDEKGVVYIWAPTNQAHTHFEASQCNTDAPGAPITHSTSRSLPSIATSTVTFSSGVPSTVTFSSVSPAEYFVNRCGDRAMYLSFSPTRRCVCPGGMGIRVLHKTRFKRLFVLNFSCVYPEPVLVQGSFLASNGSQKGVFRTTARTACSTRA